MSDLHKSGFCDFFFELLRAVCSRSSRRNSSISYQELRGENSVQRTSSDSTSGPTDLYSPTAGSSNGVFENTDDTSGAVTSLAEDSSRLMEKELARFFAHTVLYGVPSGLLRKFHSCTHLSKSGATESIKAVVDNSYAKQAEVLLSKADEWDFDSQLLHELTGGHGLAELGIHLFVRYGLISHFNLQPENCWKLFQLIEKNYHRDNPYHNAVHATDVAQAVHVFIQQPHLLQHFLKIEILVLFIAAFCHDLDHPGVNQTFLTATNHPLAVIYRDKAMGKDDLSPQPQTRRSKFLQRLKFFKSEKTKDKPTTSKNSGTWAFLRRKKKTQDVGSILERHHWRMAFGCITESGIFDNMKAQLKSIKTMLKSLILATDITRQHIYLKKFRNLTRENLDMSLAEHRLVVMQIALKTADISNPGRSWAISQKWSEKVCEEFFAQGDKERKLNIAVSKYCDRTKDTIPSIQIGFFEHVVLPLYSEWDKYHHSVLSSKLIFNLMLNLAKWKQQAAPARKLSSAEPRPRSTPGFHTESTERLLEEAGACVPRVGPGPNRRFSYSPSRAAKVKDALRRLSAPLHALAEAPRSIVDVLQRGDSAQRKPRRSVEEIHRSRSVSRMEPTNTVKANRSRSASRANQRMLRAFRSDACSNSHESSSGLDRPRSSRPTSRVSRSKSRTSSSGLERPRVSRSKSPMSSSMSSSGLERPRSPRPTSRVNRSKSRISSSGLERPRSPRPTSHISRSKSPTSSSMSSRGLERPRPPRPKSRVSSSKSRRKNSRLERPHSPRPLLPVLRVKLPDESPPTSAELSAKDNGSTNGIRFGHLKVEWDSDVISEYSTSGTTSAYPASMSTHSSDIILALDNAPAAVVSCVAMVHVTACAESCEVLPHSVAPELVRRRGSAPVLAMPATRRPTVTINKISGSCNVIAEAMPIVRRSSLPVMTGIAL